MATSGRASDGPGETRADHDRTYWRDTAPSLDLSPALGRIEVDVAVVGGGILGLTTAVLALQAGLSVVVLEARELASGTTGGTTGKLTSQNGMQLSQLRRHSGAEGARRYATATRRGIELFDQLVEDHDIACDREVAAAHLAAVIPKMDRQVSAEAEASREAGLRVLENEPLAEIEMKLTRSLTVPDQRQLHAVKYVHGLANAVTAAGGRVHERSRVMDVAQDRPGSRRWKVTTEQAVAFADHVVLATRLPTHRDIRMTFGRAKSVSSVGIAARMSTEAPRGMYLFKGERDWSIRSSRTATSGEHLVAVGMSEPTGSSAAIEPRSEELTAWTRGHFPITDVEHAWMAQDQQPADGRPYIGQLWGEGLWTATGFAKWGLAAGTAAAELLVTLMTGGSDPYGGFFSASRLERPSGWKSLLRANLRVGALFVGDRALSIPRSLDDLAPGEGKVLRRGRTPIAVSRDDAGQLHTVSATCTHLGCLVRWNREERTWDCGCHGSRFAPDGEVLEAPATTPLRPIERDG